MKVLYFSTVNWRWIKQRPHFICEYLTEKQLNITYFSITPFLKQKIFNKRLNDYLYINDKFVLPYSSKIRFVKYINIIYVRKILDKKYDLVILTHPEQYEYLPKRLKDDARIIYECMDNIPYFYKGNKRCEIQNKEKQICKRAHMIITSSFYLKNKIVKEYNISSKKLEVIKNGLDKSIRSESRSLIKLKSPNLIYIGTIGEWLDISILNKFVQDNPEYSIYLIGPVDNAMMKKVDKNIVFLGTVKHEDVKMYIKEGDIMLIPFKVNELIKGVDPVKLYEYLALSKPVITSYWNELEIYRNNCLVNFYENYEQFVLAIERIKKIHNAHWKINKRFIELNKWERRVERYIEVLNKVMITQK
ncbi:glycosyltransferase [Clostridium beijerinckii]|uniref:glycosyltransferase n=1 Tax=Clostridium beijerinckii TaxID=1520 RepID=UPI0015702A9A|nr:glycosyltransferase [Clostridium beijerinckii]NRT74184.1 glycosyltransferase involved in cell wall biosynthesis [Clostridium beijerinckii]